MLSQLLSGNFTMQDIIAEILAVLVIILLILPFHEWAHAFTASLLGDKGIKQRGRLSFNPVSHIDPIGALCMLFFGFGWARPVPVDPRKFKNPKVGMAITALMGPVANLVAGFAGLIIFNILYKAAFMFMYTNPVGMFISVFLRFYITVNVNLAVFNLLPIPPLDGSKILFTFLPDKAVEFCYRYQMFFFIALFLMISFGPLSGLLSYLSNGLLRGMTWLASLPFALFG